MAIEGFREYRKREFCNDIKCPVQIELSRHPQGSEEHERIRSACKDGCRHTTHEFHYWLIDRGFLIIKPKEEG